MSNGGIIRYGSLVVVVLQTTVTVLLLRWTRTRPDHEPYVASTAVLSSEVVKIIVCFATLFIDSKYSLTRALQQFIDEILLKPRETAKLIVPSGLYALQNNLLYVALTNLDAATYQVTYQLKILTTALFSVFLLKKKITKMQWIALCMLTAGVIMVQLPKEAFQSSNVKNESESMATMAPTQEDSHINRSVGLAAVLIACFSSGLAGVYFEMLVKTGQQTSIVIRNLQLGLFSVVFTSFGVIYNDLNVVTSKGFFQGYDSVVVLLVLIQAFGGLVVALAVKYADNILKVFATSISIILSTICSYFLLNDLSTGPFFIMGASIVILSTVIYGKTGAPSPGLKRRSSPSLSHK